MKPLFRICIILQLLITVQTISHEAFSQDAKRLAYINSNEILTLLPHTRNADSALKVLQQVLAITADDYEKEFNDKLERFNRDSIKWTVVIKESERKKLMDLYNRSYFFQQEAEQTLDNKKKELIFPIEEKVKNAIREVAREHGYTYVLESQVFFVSPAATDITEAVKKKLSIK